MRIAVALIVVLVGAPEGWNLRAGDWSQGAVAQGPEWFQWRGPERDGHSPETGLLQQWPQGGPPRLWQGLGAGDGFSSFSTFQGRLYTQGARGNTEYVMA